MQWNSTDVHDILNGTSVISEFNVILNGIPLKSMLLNGTPVKSMLYWKASHWSQCYQMKHQWIQCRIESSHWVKWYIEWNISEFNDIINGMPLKSMLLNGTSVNSIYNSMESHWSQCYWLEYQWIQSTIQWNPTEVNEFNAVLNHPTELSYILNGIPLKGIPLKSMLLNGTSVNSML
jgi:hypothetical protein